MKRGESCDVLGRFTRRNMLILLLHMQDQVVVNSLTYRKRSCQQNSVFKLIVEGSPFLPWRC